MSPATILEWRDRVVVILTSVVTISLVVSQASAELVGVIAGWDGEWLNLVFLLPAIVSIIRKVTPVSKEERGLLP